MSQTICRKCNQQNKIGKNKLVCNKCRYQDSKEKKNNKTDAQEIPPNKQNKKNQLKDQVLENVIHVRSVKILKRFLKTKEKIVMSVTLKSTE